ncbi:hypothetical protein TanjilG_01076 [Lupinus angustifolius]|uniref:Uncharacterized protein n=1 Tax=Lupinus angustifolius TaxID=3871 RepID=A0A1J7IKP0_LUPAN|nr:PREDICTED: transcription factor RAX3-like [Lupinus angustifolius]OIW15553.1 hypothetical protein TanjilG_01076 [Lupinus angustifolius]
MGRAPCCDKSNVKKGPWSPEEDSKLKFYIEKHGTGSNWLTLPQKIGLKRCGKSCRLRWLNYLRPNLRHGGFSEEEDNIICSLYISIGSRWSVIAAQLPGRTDNDIKNYWNTRLKKKLLWKHRKEQQQALSNGGNNRAVKKESNRESRSDSLSFVPENSTHHEQLYNWQQMPMLPLQPLPYTNQSPSFNNEDSIKKFLRRFYDDNYHPTLDGLLNHHEFSNGIYKEQVHMVSSSACISNSNINNNEVQYSQTGQYGFDLVQGQGSTFTSSIEEVVSTNTNNYPQRLDGLEFFYGEDIINNKIMGSSSTSCSQSSNWGETNTQIYHHHPLVSSNYQVQGLIQETHNNVFLQKFSYREMQ